MVVGDITSTMTYETGTTAQKREGAHLPEAIQLGQPGWERIWCQTSLFLQCVR